jgi:type I restriction-modification system DNA methylase subunit
MDTELMEKQVISKKRVTDHGEVLTGRREVNAMLDLVKQETERIESRFLEPACGTGNFLTEILKRKAITQLSPHCVDNCVGRISGHC